MTGVRVNLNLEVGSRSKISELKLALKKWDFYSDTFFDCAWCGLGNGGEYGGEGSRSETGGS